jgi:hypothetical protein
MDLKCTQTLAVHICQHIRPKASIPKQTYTVPNRTLNSAMNVFQIVACGPYLLIVETLQQAEEIALVKAVECFKAGLVNFNQQKSHMIG